MANQLTLSVSAGVRGRRFQANINGLTTGKVEVLNDGTPGFSVVNGRLMSQSLPYDVNTVVLREYEPGVGQGYRDTRIEITAATAPTVADGADGTVVIGGSGGAPSAKTATASASGAVYTYARLLGSTSTLALVSGSNSNLTLNTTTGVISATSAIAVGASQTATVRESLAGVSVEVPVTIKGVSGGTPTPTPTPTPSPSIGGVAIGSAGAVGSYNESFTLADGDDFDGPLDLLGPAAPFGRYGTTRGGYINASAGQHPRYSSGLGGTDVDPLWTGVNDKNRGVPLSMFADMVSQAGSVLTLNQRPPTAGEVAFAEGKPLVASMIHTGMTLLGRAPIVFEWLEQRAANFTSHMTGWVMQATGFASDNDLELDMEGGSHPDGSGDGRNVEANINVWNNGGRDSAASSQGSPNVVSQATTHKYALKITDVGDCEFWIDEVLIRTFTTQRAKALAKAFYLLFTNHTYAAGGAAWPGGSAPYMIHWWRAWSKGHLPVQAAPQTVSANSGVAFSLVLPSQTALWGRAVSSEKVESCMMEPNEPGGTDNGVTYGSLPTGVTYDAGTRTLSGTLATPGRLNVVCFADEPGITCKPHRIAVNIGPKINLADFSVTQGQDVSVDVYAAVDCGVLTTNGTSKVKPISVSGLPTGLSYSDSTGLITGKTTVAVANFSITINAANSIGQSASKTIVLGVVAPPVEQTYAYESDAALVGQFDASNDASFATATGAQTTWANKVAGQVGVSKPGGTSASPTRVASQQAGRSIMRFLNSGAAATSTVMDTALDTPLGKVLQGADTTFTLVLLMKPTAAKTGFVAGWSEQLNASSARQAALVRRSGSGSSFRYGVDSSSPDRTVASPLIPDGSWTLVTIRHTGGLTDMWYGNTKVLDGVAHTSSSVWNNPRFSIGNIQTNTDAPTRYPTTAFEGDIAEVLAFNAAKSDAFLAQMRSDMATKWSLTI